jgi:hypothetical protein
MNDLAMLGVKDIDESITDRMMMVEIQPPTNIRRRYQSDGKRQIEKSRSKPMTIKVYLFFCFTTNSVSYSLVAKLKKL